MRLGEKLIFLSKIIPMETHPEVKQIEVEDISLTYRELNKTVMIEYDFAYYYPDNKDPHSEENLTEPIIFPSLATQECLGKYFKIVCEVFLIFFNYIDNEIPRDSGKESMFQKHPESRSKSWNDIFRKPYTSIDSDHSKKSDPKLEQYRRANSLTNIGHFFKKSKESKEFKVEEIPLPSIPLIPKGELSKYIEKNTTILLNFANTITFKFEYGAVKVKIVCSQKVKHHIPLDFK